MLISTCLVSGVSTTAEVFSYIISIAIFCGMPYARRTRNILFMSTDSKAFLKLMKIMAAFLWFLVSSMIICLRARIWDDVDRKD